MQKAIEIAKHGLESKEVPVGCVIVLNTEVIAIAHNLIVSTNDPTAHAEIIAIKKATNFLTTRYLDSCDMYITLEPCPMCTTAISFARIKRLYIGTLDPKGGGIYHGPKLFYNQSNLNHIPEHYHGFSEKECAEMLSNFFKKLR